MVTGPVLPYPGHSSRSPTHVGHRSWAWGSGVTGGRDGRGHSAQRQACESYSLPALSLWVPWSNEHTFLCDRVGGQRRERWPIRYSGLTVAARGVCNYLPSRWLSLPTPSAACSASRLLSNSRSRSRVQCMDQSARPLESMPLCLAPSAIGKRDRHPSIHTWSVWVAPARQLWTPHMRQGRDIQSQPEMPRISSGYATECRKYPTPIHPSDSIIHHGTGSPFQGNA